MNAKGVEDFWDSVIQDCNAGKRFLKKQLTQIIALKDAEMRHLSEGSYLKNILRIEKNNAEKIKELFKNTPDRVIEAHNIHKKLRDNTQSQLDLFIKNIEVDTEKKIVFKYEEVPLVVMISGSIARGEPHSLADYDYLVIYDKGKWKKLFTQKISDYSTEQAEIKIREFLEKLSYSFFEIEVKEATPDLSPENYEKDIWGKDRAFHCVVEKNEIIGESVRKYFDIRPHNPRLFGLLFEGIPIWDENGILEEIRNILGKFFGLYEINHSLTKIDKWLDLKKGMLDGWLLFKESIQEGTVRRIIKTVALRPFHIWFSKMYCYLCYLKSKIAKRQTDYNILLRSLSAPPLYKFKLISDMIDELEEELKEKKLIDDKFREHIFEVALAYLGYENWYVNDVIWQTDLFELIQEYTGRDAIGLINKIQAKLEKSREFFKKVHEHNKIPLLDENNISSAMSNL